MHAPRPALRLLRLLTALVGIALLAASAARAQSPDPAQLPPVPGLDQDLHLRSKLSHSQRKFKNEKTGLVAYLGGSITHNPGWTQLVDAELSRRFPEAKFTFVHAGIPSVDSSGHAFRFQRDILEKGIPDLLFVEAAVNDLHNERTPVEQLRGMEGVIRRARRANPDIDIVMLHFAEPRYTADYEAGRVPPIIATHERVAEHYQVTSLDLAHEVQRRIAAKQFDWARDFKDLHPSPFGQQLYYQAVRRLFDQAWREPNEEAKPADGATALPEPLDPFAYDAGQRVSPNQAIDANGFRVVAGWRPEGNAGTRAGFVDVPMWVGERPGDRFSVRFDGRAIGLWITAGPDTGIVEYRVDCGEWKRRDTFTHWSRGLHLPWVLMLETELPSGSHQLDLRLTSDKNAAGTGTALRVRDILVNGSAYKLPPLREIQVRSSLDQSPQPSLLWTPERKEGQPAPILIYLHSWSGDYRQDNSPWLKQAVDRGWVYLHPNFRGINKQPEACGSRLARQDILDALAQVRAEFPVDAERIYLAGTSGGGHMSLLMAAYHPEKFSAVSAWVGISDLADWYQFHVKDGKPDHYAQMTVQSLGGAPYASAAVDASYRERSPLFHLGRVGDLPVEIAAGVTDGKTGSVPIFHSLRAFNVVAQANGHAPVSDAEMNQLWTDGRLRTPQASDQQADAVLGREIRLRRTAGGSRVTIFDGGHEGLAPAGCDWLARQKRTTR